jgi:twitching motility protein PilT
VERIVGVFPLSDQQTIRNRFARVFRFIISQRLLPRREGKGRVAVLEILKSTMRTREYIEKGEGEGKSLVDAMTDGSGEGMQHFDGELERLIREGVVELEAGLSYASNAGNLQLCLADFIEDQSVAAAAAAQAAAANEPAAENVGTTS